MAASAVTTKKPFWTGKRRENMWFYLLVSPWIIGFLLFTVVPILYSIYISFTEWTMLSSPHWVGFKNFEEMYHDPDIKHSLWITTKYSLISVPLRMTIALLLAMLLNEVTRFVGLFRTAFYLPSVVASVAVAVLWQWILNPRFGPFNAMLRKVGLEGPNWFSDPKYALYALIIMSSWGVGGEMLIFLAGLKGIPRILYEAAEIDGANRFQRFRRVTLPMLSPTIFFNLVMAVIGSFQTFDSAFVISTARAGAIGSPLKSTLFYMLYLYQSAFSNLRMGYASAMAWLLFVVIVAVTFLINYSSKKWVFYGDS
ncbi:MAG TPA: sugar ABC transporter permease [Aggregatilineaceae bacterium]|nr:sugar ABC transporter permease [Aggregatilineaceae bacterium]